MKPETQESVMRRYLLGDLPESETNELEAEVLRDDEKFERMWELENNLRRSHEQLRTENQSLQNRDQALSQELATAQQLSKQLESEIARLRAGQDVGAQPSRQPTILSLLLSPMLVRSDGAPQTVIPQPQTDLIRLQMAVAREKTGRFQVSISTVEGRRVWEQQIRPGDGRSTTSIISADVPAEMLPVGDYILTLSEMNSTDRAQELNRYFFRVTMQ